MADDDIDVRVAAIMGAADSMFRAQLKPLVIAAVQSEVAPGGSLNDRIVSDSIAQAQKWYGMYTPTHYIRGWTFINPGNIRVKCGRVDTDGYSWQMSGGGISNASPHASWSDGFPMRNGLHRPGGYIVSHGKDYESDITIDAAEANELYLKCIQQAVNM